MERERERERAREREREKERDIDGWMFRGKCKQHLTWLLL